MEDISKDLKFEKFFKIMIVAMRLNRCHPDIPRDWKWVCQFVVMQGLFFFVFCILIYSIIFHDVKEKDFTQACSNGALCDVFCVITFDYCVMLRYQDLLKGLMDEMKVDYSAAKYFPLAEQQIILNYAKKGKKIVLLWLVIGTLGGGTFIGKSFSLMIYYLVRGDFKLVHLYDLTYPNSIEEIKYEPAVFFPLFGLFLFFDIYASTMYIAMSALGPVLMLHGCGQLELARERLINIFNEKNMDKSTLEKLNDIVKHLQKTYRFLEGVKDGFKVLYEVTLKATTIIVPITLYQIIESFRIGELRIEFITILVGAITLSSIPCNYSDQLMDMGEHVRLAVYMCGWEAHTGKQRRLRNMLLLIHARAAREVAIRTMFRTVSLDALADVGKQSYAIFNLLNAAPL